MRAILVLLLAVCAASLTACRGDDPEPTPTRQASLATPPTPAGPAASPTARPAASPASPGTIRVSDGTCQAEVPATWTQEAPGTGTTPAGYRYSIFGNPLPSDDAWQTAVALLKEQESRQPGAQIMEGDGWIRVTYADNKGFAYRARFGDVACDVRITTRGDAIGEADRAAWEAIIASLGPVT